MFFFSLFFIWPLINSVRYSLTDWKGGGAAKFIGLENFREMFDPKSDQQFMPASFRKPLFKDTYELPYSIDEADYNELLMNHVNGVNDLAILREAYGKQENGKYTLNEKFNEFSLFDEFERITGMENDRIAAFLGRIKDMADSGTPPDAAEYIATPGKNISADRDAIPDIVNGLYRVYEVKKILAEDMYRNEIKPGVTGFALLYAAINLVCGNIIALLLALFLDGKLKLSRILHALFFFPAALSLITVSFLWSFLFDKVLASATGADIWLGNPQAAPFLVSFVGVWRNCGWMILIYTAGLQCIPAEYIEAADIDGANRLQKFARITGPLLVPSVGACALWSMADSLRLFDIVFGFESPFKYTNNSVPVVLDLYINAMKSGRFGYATAKALSLCLIVAAINAARLLIAKRGKAGR